MVVWGPVWLAGDVFGGGGAHILSDEAAPVKLLADQAGLLMSCKLLKM
jgi:hypothetical protein